MSHGVAGPTAKGSARTLDSLREVGAAMRHENGIRTEVLRSDWRGLLERSKLYACANVDSMLTEIEAQGWEAKHIILSPWERTTYTLLHCEHGGSCTR